MNITNFDHIMFFIIGIVMPLLSYLSSRSTEGSEEIEVVLPEKKHIYFSNGLMLWIAALLVLTAWNISGSDWKLFGFQWPEINTPTIVMTILLVAIYVLDSAYNLIAQRKQEVDLESKGMEKILPATWAEYSQFTFLAISAGVCEEFIFRGFTVNYIKQMFGTTPYSYYLAIIIPAVIFSIGHLYQGWLNVVKIVSIALLFGGIFMWSKSLLIVVIIHSLVDLVSGALIVYSTKSNASKNSLSDDSEL